MIPSKTSTGPWSLMTLDGLQMGQCFWGLLNIYVDGIELVFIRVGGS